LQRSGKAIPQSGFSRRVSGLAMLSAPSIPLFSLFPPVQPAVFRLNFLMEQERVAETVLVVETAAQMPSMQGQEGQQMRAMVVQLKSRTAKQASSGGK